MVTTTRRLLTAPWKANVEVVERAMTRLGLERPLANGCSVAFFEIHDDPQLHVNVTHRHQTRSVKGWAGPARLPQGFVHNRRFDDVRSAHVIRHIRDMVCAERI